MPFTPPLSQSGPRPAFVHLIHPRTYRSCSCLLCSPMGVCKCVSQMCACVCMSQVCASICVHFRGVCMCVSVQGCVHVYMCISQVCVCVFVCVSQVCACVFHKCVHVCSCTFHECVHVWVCVCVSMCIWTPEGKVRCFPPSRSLSLETGSLTEPGIHSFS